MTAHLDPVSVAQYLADHPHFFEENPELVSKIKLASTMGGRTVSLQEKQMEVLRLKIKAMELRMADLMRIGQENDGISNKFLAWTQSLLMARNDVDLPHVLIDGLQTHFGVPHATLRLWNVAEEYAHTWFAETVSEDARIFASGLKTPFCGANQDFEAVSWIEEADSVQSLVMLPLRASESADTFGMLVLGSPDPQRFTSDMATDFLSHIGQTASAAMTCLIY
jgi:uncharacterized protein YigA (DUF484 family)